MWDGERQAANGMYNKYLRDPPGHPRSKCSDV